MFTHWIIYQLFKDHAQLSKYLYMYHALKTNKIIFQILAVIQHSATNPFTNANKNMYVQARISRRVTSWFQSQK